jgi:hypothetical protein
MDFNVTYREVYFSRAGIVSVLYGSANYLMSEL